MKAIMLMFDSLNRRMLEPYGSTWVQTPNFKRLAERTVTFDNCFVGEHAMYARAPRNTHGALQLPPSQLGSAGTVRRLDARNSQE